MKKIHWIIIVILILLFIQLFNKKEVYQSIETFVFQKKLSDYAIFQGKMSNLIPASNMIVYELSSQLFTDYADKQRMILLPKREKMIAKNNGLPSFPEGTIIVKTFFYKKHFNGDSLKQKNVETRLLVKNKSVWNAATYQWNEEQNEAYLNESGKSVPVNFIDISGKRRSTTYKIPKKTDCATCHKQDGNLSPLGPKIRNLNFKIFKDSLHINQLEYFKSIGKLKNITENFSTTPDYSDENIEIKERARAYFDMNCAHCHSKNGYADYIQMDLSFDTSFDRSRIYQKSPKIITRMTISGALHMPKIGTTINHDEGVKLILDYVKTLDKE